MSKSEMTRFAAAVSADAGLKALAKAKGTDVPGVIELARSKGYDIGEADIEEHVQARRAELSEEQLGSVAGGLASTGGSGGRFPIIRALIVIF
jgi:predicted ribosomally synthesized peptide with nif11-like leader